MAFLFLEMFSFDLAKMSKESPCRATSIIPLGSALRAMVSSVFQGHGQDALHQGTAISPVPGDVGVKFRQA